MKKRNKEKISMLRNSDESKREAIRGIGIVLILILALILFAVLLVVQKHEWEREGIRPAPSIPTLPTNMDEFDESKGQIDEAEETIQSLREKETQDYLVKKWGEIVKKNPVTRTIDSALQKVSILFRFFIGENYELSITFWIIVIFYIWFTLWISGWLLLINFLPKNTTGFVAWGISTILGQFHFFRIVVEGVIRLMFSPETWWIRTLIMFAFIALVLVLEYTGKYVSKWVMERRKKLLEEEAKQSMKKMNAYVRNAIDSGEAQD